jgi:O-antigen/teichoic acid export membrane protein
LYQNFVLAFFATDTDIGNFKAAQNFVTLISILSVPITTALLPGFAKLDPSNAKRIKYFFRLSNKYTSLLIVPVTILIIIYSTDMVQIIYGSAWQTAPVFLATYSLIYLLVGLGYLTLSSLFNGLGETKTTLMMNALAFLTLGILSPVLGNFLGVQGVILAFLIASAVATTLGSYWAKRKYQIGLRSPAVAKIYMIAVFSAVPSFLLFRFAHLPSVVDLVIGVSLYLIIYITLTPLVRIVTTAELKTVSKLTHKTRPLRVLVNPLIKYELKISRMAQPRQSPADSQD